MQAVIGNHSPDTGGADRPAALTELLGDDGYRCIGIQETVANDLPDHLKWRLEEIKPGYAYLLEVVDVSNKAGEYSGRLIVRTDQPQKPELVIIIKGYIQEN